MHSVLASDKNTMNTPIPIDPAKEKRAQYAWTAAIVGFFLIQGILWAVAISLTASDQSHAVVEDYDQLGLNWEQEKQLQLASKRLGWQAIIAVDEKGDIRRNHPLTLSISDKNGRPISRAAIKLKAFHRGRAANPQMLEFKESEPGQYVSTLRLNRDGRWQFDGRATLGDFVYLIDQEIRLKSGK